MTYLKLNVGVTCHPDLLEIEGLFTQGWRLGRTVGESVGEILEMDSSDWSAQVEIESKTLSGVLLEPSAFNPRYGE